MSQQNLDLNTRSYVIKRTYNQMMESSIDKTLNNDSFIRNQLFKSALKFGGPINQDLVIHHKKNVRKSMGIKSEETNTNNEKQEKNIKNLEKEEINKNEVKFDLCNSPKDKINIFEQKTKIFSTNIYNNNNNINNNHFQFGNFYSARKVDNDNNNKNKYFVFNTEKRVANYDDFPLNENIKKEVEADILFTNNNNIVQKSEVKKEEKYENENKVKEINSNSNDNCGSIAVVNNPFLEQNNIQNKNGPISGGVINNPFLEQNNIQNKNEPINPFHSSTNTFFINNNDKNQINDNSSINNVVENPFLAISKPKIENPFKIKNPFISTNNDNNNIENNNNTKIINPFTSSNKNPFVISTSNEKNQNNNQIKNPFLQDDSYNPFISNSKDNSDNNTNNNKVLNPFLNNPNYNNIANPFNKNNTNNANTLNPFISSNNTNINIKITNPFISSNNTNNNNNIANPFTSTNNTNNPFISIQNPFISIPNPFNTQNNSQILNQCDDNCIQNTNEKEEEQDDNYNVEEEITIEKNEEALKKFKEVKYENNNKFYEMQIENLQYLGKENDKNKYFTIGPGMLSFEEDKDEKGKKRGIFVLRDLSVKNIKIQGIIFNSSIVEKVQLKKGIEIIMFKNVFATFPKYNKDNISYETKLTYIRMRVKPENLDILFKKASEFFELMKK